MSSRADETLQADARGAGGAGPGAAPEHGQAALVAPWLERWQVSWPRCSCWTPCAATHCQQQATHLAVRTHLHALYGCLVPDGLAAAYPCDGLSRLTMSVARRRVKSEQDIFELLGVPYRAPHERRA